MFLKTWLQEPFEFNKVSASQKKSASVGMVTGPVEKNLEYRKLTCLRQTVRNDGWEKGPISALGRWPCHCQPEMDAPAAVSGVQE